MIVSKQSDIKHKYELIKLLTAVIDDKYISQYIGFKGGTCAEMSGFLDRFSVDLDFDLLETPDKDKFRSIIFGIFTNLHLKNLSEKTESYFFNLKYEAPRNERNTLKISFFEDIPRSNDYEFRFLPDIGRLVQCQTQETMFANKLVTPLDRYERHKEIAGRDMYDIYYFFSQGYKFKEEIIEERTGQKVEQYFRKLINFIDKGVTENIITQDLNTLLPYDKFKKIRKTLKQDVLMFLRASI